MLRFIGGTSEVRNGWHAAREAALKQNGHIIMPREIVWMKTNFFFKQKCKRKRVFIHLSAGKPLAWLCALFLLVFYETRGDKSTELSCLSPPPTGILNLDCYTSCLHHSTCHPNEAAGRLNSPSTFHTASHIRWSVLWYCTTTWINEYKTLVCLLWRKMLMSQRGPPLKLTWTVWCLNEDVFSWIFQLKRVNLHRLTANLASLKA